MNPFKHRQLLITTLLGLTACAPSGEVSAQAFSSPHIVALGDLHGDLDATRRALRLAGAMDAQENWIGGQLNLVQTGDQLDRGDSEIAILDLLDKLGKQAEAAGGKVHVLNGNHEIMNVQGDLRYVTEQGFKSFDGLQGLNLSLPQLAQVPALAKARAAAFYPGAPFALRLARRPISLVLAGNVFVHGGILPDHVDYGLDRINKESQAWLAGQLPQIPAILLNEQGPIWTRVYSDPAIAPACDQLYQALNKIGAKRMIVGHSVHPHVSGACGDKVWRVDVGMSRFYGGPVEVLDIQGDQVKVLSESPATP
jgi:hypothetical protein